MRRPSVRVPVWLLRLLPWVLLVVLAVFRRHFEETMTRQMLLHIPLIALAGAWLVSPLAHGAGRPARKSSFWGRMAQAGSAFNSHGLSGLLYATLAGMFWMIPKALDDVLLHGPVAFAKFASVLVAGMVLVPSWGRAHPVIRVFFLGGFCWASAIAGMLYQESTSRLCNFYLLDDQVWAGRGLVILAILLPASWALAEVMRHRRRLRQQDPTTTEPGF